MCPRQQRQDFDFYLPLIMTASAVLDVGCGTGSLLGEARAAGHRGRLCGLDPAAGMLAQARKRIGIEWLDGDLNSVAFDAEFDLVVMSGNAFQVLIDDGEIAATLTGIRRSLAANGRFAFETRNPQAREWERWSARGPQVVPGPGGILIHKTLQITAPFDGRNLSFSHTFQPPHGEPLVSHSTLRFLDVEALGGFLARAGFVIEDQFGDWDRMPVKSGSLEIVTIARRQ